MRIIDFVDIIVLMSELILLRHGQSEWNKKNLFTGWVDIPLSREGIEEAFAAGQAICEIPVDKIYTSTLIRGIMTAMLAMTCHSSQKVPVIIHSEDKIAPWSRCYDDHVDKALIPAICAWELNERMYGELQGKNKQWAREQYGEEQIKMWRRGYDIAPPGGESLKMTAERTLPYFEKEILPQLKDGMNILISAHGNSLRSIVMYLDQLSATEVVELEIPTGKPRIYRFEKNSIKHVLS